jgi:hypothetical protein
MVFGVSDQDLIPLLDRIREYRRALARSGRLWNRRRCFGYIALKVRTGDGIPLLLIPLDAYLASSSLLVSAADFKVLIPVATSWLSIAVFTDGR